MGFIGGGSGGFVGGSGGTGRIYKFKKKFTRTLGVWEGSDETNPYLIPVSQDYPLIQGSTISSTTGEISESNEYTRTDYIPITGGNNYAAENYLGVDVLNCFVLYDENKMFIPAWNGEYGYACKENGEFVRLSSAARYTIVRISDPAAERFTLSTTVQGFVLDGVIATDTLLICDQFGVPWIEDENYRRLGDDRNVIEIPMEITDTIKFTIMAYE
jgi:hypothetical protein